MKRFFPEAIWTRVRWEADADARLERRSQAARLPKTDLAERHIRHVTLLPTREHLLDCLPAGAVVAEVGVDRGFFSTEILKRTKPRKLHLVDAWGDERFHEGLKKSVEQNLAAEIHAGVVEINRGMSTAVLATFAPAYFDWVYIDTDHSYETTRAELALARTRVKPDGIIAGHDFTVGNWIDGIRYGVIEAVREFCVEHDWEIRYLTTQSDGHDSFALRAIR